MPLDRLQEVSLVGLLSCRAPMVFVLIALNSVVAIAIAALVPISMKKWTVLTAEKVSILSRASI
jgi:hypothetical protein